MYVKSNIFVQLIHYYAKLTKANRITFANIKIVRFPQLTFNI